MAGAKSRKKTIWDYLETADSTFIRAWELDLGQYRFALNIKGKVTSRGKVFQIDVFWWGQEDYEKKPQAKVLVINRNKIFGITKWIANDCYKAVNRWILHVTQKGYYITPDFQEAENHVGCQAMKKFRQATR